MPVEWFAAGKPTVVGICSGAVAALLPLHGFRFRWTIGAFASDWRGRFCYWDAPA